MTYSTNDPLDYSSYLLRHAAKCQKVAITYEEKPWNPWHNKQYKEQKVNESFEIYDRLSSYMKFIIHGLWNTLLSDLKAYHHNSYEINL